MTDQAFNTSAPQVLFQEVPDEVSLAFTVYGCPLKCRGCHSAHTWNPNNGQTLSNTLYLNYLKRYGNMITCVLFFGGEWHLQALSEKLAIAKGLGFKTCLYTGLDWVPNQLRQHLTYLKTGPWRKELGGLDKPSTNQKLVELASGQLLNNRFQEHIPYVAA